MRPRQFDRAMQAMRQPGSSFKPFVYAAALDNGYTPVSKVLDAPFEMDQGPGQGCGGRRISRNEFLGDDHAAPRHRTVAQRDDGASGPRPSAWTRWCHMPIRFGVYDKLPPLLANSLGALGDHAAAAW